MGRFRFLREALAGIPTPAPGYDTLFFDSGDGFPKYKDDAGIVHSFFGASSQQKLSTLVYDVVNDYGAKGDLQTVFDGAINATATLLTSTSGKFVAGDVGKRITVAGAGASGAVLVTTIASFVSATQVNVALAASTTVTNKGTSWGTDDTTPIQNAVNAAGAAGGGIIWFGGGSHQRFGVTSTITVQSNGVQLWGAAGAHTTDIGDYTTAGGAWVCWWGGAPTTFTNGIVVQASPVQGASNPALTGFGIQSLNIDCRNGDQNGALIGLQVLSAHGFWIRDFFVNDPNAVGIDMNVVATLGEARDCTRWHVERLCVRAIDNPAGAVTSGVTTSSAVTLTTTPQNLTVTANALPTTGFAWFATNLGYPVLVNYTGGGGTTTLTGCTVSSGEAVNAPATVSGGNVVQAVPGNACCHRFDGSTTANTCCSDLIGAQFSHGTTWGPAAFEFRNSDSIQVYNMIVNGGNATNDGAINRVRKPGVRLCGSNTNTTLAARNNQFSGGSAGTGGVSVMGVSNTGTRLTAISQPHYWDNYQMANGEPIPVVEGGAFFAWYPNGGFAAMGHPATPSIADQAITAATLTLVTGTLIAIPPQGFQVGTMFRWLIRGSAAAAGTAANTITVRIGTNGTTADAVVATFTTTAGTAVASEFAIEIVLTIRTLGAAATATAKAVILNSTATGFINATVNVLPGTMAAFNSTTAQQFIHVDITTGASKTATITQAMGECISPANP